MLRLESDQQTQAALDLAHKLIPPHEAQSYPFEDTARALMAGLILSTPSTAEKL